MQRITYTTMLILLMPLLVVPATVTAETPETALSEAKTLFKQASDLQGAWVSTEDLIKKAEEALKKGDNKTATQLATKAREEAQASISQATDQLKNWSEPPYIKQ